MRTDAQRTGGWMAGRDGQAIVELMIGLVAVLVVTLGMVQLAEISIEHSKTMQKARRDVGNLSIQEAGVLASPDYIRLWSAGGDKRTYSADDEFSDADTGLFKADIVNKVSADSSGWAVLNAAPGDVMTELRDSAKPVEEFGLMRGADDERVDLISGIQSLLYNSESIKIETEVWMVWTKGIY